MLCRFGRRTDVNVVYVPSRVIPACGLTDPASHIQVVETTVSVSLQDALESGEMSLRMNALAGGRVCKPDRSRFRRTRTTVVPDVDPQATRAGLPVTRRKYRDRRVI